MRDGDGTGFIILSGISGPTSEQMISLKHGLTNCALLKLVLHKFWSLALQEEL
jgi:hypothetical protein